MQREDESKTDAVADDRRHWEDPCPRRADDDAGQSDGELLMMYE